MWINTWFDAMGDVHVFYNVGLDFQLKIRKVRELLVMRHGLPEVNAESGWMCVIYLEMKHKHINGLYFILKYDVKIYST